MFDNLYSRMVAWLKILLPLAALAILSTVFIFARAPDIERAIPYAPVTDDFTGDERIGEPRYVGMTRDGSAISIDSQFIRPKSGEADVMESGAFLAEIETSSGKVIGLRSEQGTVDAPAGIATLSGAVSVTTSDGYLFETEELSTHLNETLIETAGEISGTAPFGTLKAGRMRITAKENESYVLDFNGGVHLIYRP